MPVVVLKFGSSVLASPKDLSTAVDEAYRRLRQGMRVLSVVSAFAGETNRLLGEATMTLGDAAAPEAIAAYVATGEMQSAALFVGALMHAGIAARQVDPREIHLRVGGHLLEAEPISVNADRLNDLWEAHSILVLPGFFGIDDHGRVALLGRGGSDMSALFLANAIDAGCHLVKNVSGVYDRDPARDPNGARRYTLISWREAAAVAGPLIQPKALEFAAQRRIVFSVGRANDVLSTLITDASASVYGSTNTSPTQMKVALLGFGTVGRGIFERLVAQPERFELVTVVTRQPERSVANGIPPSLASSDLGSALSADIDLVIECIGGVEPVSAIMKEALAMGKAVVSANKAAIAENWVEFAPYLNEPGRQLWYSAAVGGAVPVLETLAGLADQVLEVRGVINGTANFVLDSIAKGDSFNSAVRGAQAAGFAEVDPSRDLSGTDTLDKLRLVAYMTFGAQSPIVPAAIRGISPDLVGDQTYQWRQIGRAIRHNGTVTLSVAPELVPRQSFFGQTRGAENRIEIELNDGEILRLTGQGAGRWPTTTSVMADVLEVARRRMIGTSERESNL